MKAQKVFLEILPKGKKKFTTTNPISESQIITKLLRIKSRISSFSHHAHDTMSQPPKEAFPATLLFNWLSVALSPAFLLDARVLMDHKVYTTNSFYMFSSLRRQKRCEWDEKMFIFQ